MNRSDASAALQRALELSRELAAAADGPIAFELKDEQSAGQLRPLADEATRYRYVVMPMRI